MAKLGELFEAQPKSKIKAGNGLEKGKYKFFNSSNIQTKFYDTAQYNGEALIFGTGGNPSVHYCKGEFSTSTDCIVFFPTTEQINVKMVYQYLSGNIRILEEGFKGAGIKHISKSYIQEINIPELPLSTQYDISNNLDKVTHTIDLCNAILEKLDLLVKSRFVEMFCGTNDWKYVHIQDICTDMRTGPFGSALHHDEFVDSGVFVLGIDNAVENEFSYNRMRYITGAKYQQLKRYTVKPLDVIITIMGTVGRSAVIPIDIPLAINTKHLACLTLDRNKANSTFIAKAIQIHPELLSQLSLNSKGAIMDGLNLTIIKGLKFRLPPIYLQEQFAAFVEQTDKSKSAVKQVLEKAETLKKALMQEYFG